MLQWAEGHNLLRPAEGPAGEAHPVALPAPAIAAPASVAAAAWRPASKSEPLHARGGKPELAKLGQPVGGVVVGSFGAASIPIAHVSTAHGWFASWAERPAEQPSGGWYHRHTVFGRTALC